MASEKALLHSSSCATRPEEESSLLPYVSAGTIHSPKKGEQEELFSNYEWHVWNLVAMFEGLLRILKQGVCFEIFKHRKTNTYFCDRPRNQIMGSRQQ
mmetsp:Transcript_6905/g.19981  ORF Transcript_6905/g.19981 Transcript_6905/m.19981 type:complete len:98 (+) Transcript_6905:1508-1801(+)